MAPIFPFTAIVGQDKMKRALVLNAISPAIGGVVIRGERGTAKSTAVRALAALLPEIEVVADCPFNCDPNAQSNLCDYCQVRVDRGETLPVASRQIRVVDLPVSATEDRVVGTLDIEQAIKRGEKRFEPGVLASANRSVLYVDEVNLLDDHVVDLLLDSAAMGVNVVEREGISFSHPAHFILVGTMNPEEGELRPQLLDRFGLCVEIEGIKDPEQRMLILERRIDFEREPDMFFERWESSEEGLSERIVHARTALPSVRYTADNLYTIAQLTSDLGVDGHRADITILKAGLANAAFEGRTQINEIDILTAAELALPHRMKRRPLQDTDGELRALHERLEEARREAEEEAERRAAEADGQGSSDGESVKKNGESAPDDSVDESDDDVAEEGDDSGRAGESRPHYKQVPDTGYDGASDSDDQKVNVGLPQKPKKFQSSLDKLTRRNAGKRSFSRTSRKRGRYVKSRPASDRIEDVAFDATFRRAAPQQIHRRDDDLALSIRRDEIQRKVRMRRTANLILFVVDASWSMAASERMEATKGAILGLLMDAYQKRDQVGMIIFQKDDAEVILPPTSSIELARQALEEIPVGGKTPLSSGLYTTYEILEREQRRNPEVVPLVIVLTDGAGNVSMGKMPPQQEALKIAEFFAQDQIRTIVINTEHEAFDRGLAQTLADAMEAECLTLKEFSVGELTNVVQRYVA